MELKPGYKLTEVGVIPEDWEVFPVGSLGTFSKGRGIRKDEAASGEIPCIRYGEIYTHHNDIVRSFNSRISDEVARSSKRLFNGDLLFAGSGETKEEIGKCVAFLCDEETYAGGDIVILTPKKGNSKFFGYLFNTPIVVRQKASKGQGDAIVHISSSALSSIIIPFPLLSEQEAIAETLSDVDALIDALDRLIAKKRDLKQAAMQQLLTGQTRLPGFSGEWGVKRLGEISLMHGRIGWQGLTQAEFTSNAEDPFLITGTDFKNGDINWGTAYHVSYERYEVAPQIQLHSDDVLMTKDGTIGKMLYVKAIPYPGLATLNSHLLVLRPINNSYIPRFLFYQMLSRRFLNHIEQNKSGSTFFGLGQEATSRFMVLLPCLNEQQAIAAVLSDMDAEIAALEARCDKTRGLKQGMMQELLTGRTRLV